MELLLFYEKESSPWLHSCCLQPYKFHYFQLKETDWEVGKKFDILIYAAKYWGLFPFYRLKSLTF
jgi:hypothetical protein